MDDNINIGYNIDDFYYLQTYEQYNFPKIDANGNLIRSATDGPQPYIIDSASCSSATTTLGDDVDKCYDWAKSGGSSMQTSDGNLIVNNWTNNGDNCFVKELCKNKEKAAAIYDLRYSHSGSGERYLDTSVEYNYEVMKTINLSIGNLFLLYLIFYNLI